MKKHIHPNKHQSSQTQVPFQNQSDMTNKGHAVYVWNLNCSYPHEQWQEGDIEADADSEAADGREDCQKGALISLGKGYPC